MPKSTELNFWKKLSNLGINESEPPISKKRFRLTNRMIFIGICITLPYYAVFISLDSVLPLIQVSVLTLLMGSLFFISKNGKHDLAAILLCSLAILHVLSVSLIIEGGTARYFLIPISILGFTLLKGKRRAIGLFFTALAAFFVAEFAPQFDLYLVPENPGPNRTMYLINMVLIFGGTLFFIMQLKITNALYEKNILSQKQLIENQHVELQATHKDIKDSIHYAKRIQSALLPPHSSFEKLLSDSFVLYLPKDIVAGDFYWLEEQEGKIFVAAADCTGHGVPGAMVSVICKNALNKTLKELNITEAGEILDSTRDIVIHEFKKSEEDVRDGMDIALCVIDGEQVNFAGAHNPLWVIRNGECIELKADKQPIGKYDFSKTFTSKNMNLEKGDALYIFTDGYADQFGGEQGKKLKLKNFKDFILSVHQEPMHKQEELFRDYFNNWKGTFEQIDDVCVIGFRY